MVCISQYMKLVQNVIALLLDSDRDRGEVLCMPEEREVAAKFEIEETNSIVTEDQEMTVTRKKLIK